MLGAIGDNSSWPFVASSSRPDGSGLGSSRRRSYLSTRRRCEGRPTMQLVACNVYVAASAASADVLTSLLKRAQEHCRRIRSTGPIGIIHAFSDVPYDRSSLHIAGAPSLVSYF